MSNKNVDDSFNSWIDKKIPLYEIRYFPETYSHNKNKTKVELDLSDYTIKSDSKELTSIDTSKFMERHASANIE